MMMTMITTAIAAVIIKSYQWNQSRLMAAFFVTGISKDNCGKPLSAPI